MSSNADVLAEIRSQAKKYEGARMDQFYAVLLDELRKALKLDVAQVNSDAAESAFVYNAKKGGN